MTTGIGIRELRNGLSKHLAEVRSGRTLTVTDHGKPIARIIPIEQPSALERLIAEGVVRPPLRPKRKAPIPTPADGPRAADGPISELVRDQRS